jgi:DNA-binding LacI/PurR family transcriptional regulator
MSIRDVAALAGVSPATVSRVFTRPDAVALQTRQRVMAAAEELRYTPNAVARSLARRRTGNLGLIVPDIALAFSAVIIKAVQHRARSEGYALFVADPDDPARYEDRIAAAMATQVDGLVLSAPQMSEDQLRELAALTPLVLINRKVEGLPAVLMQATDAAGHAVEHLHALGHRELAYLAGPPGYSNEMRQWAFGETCRRLEVRAIEFGPFEPMFSAGVRAADLVLATEATGVVAYNDEIAVGLLHRFADRNVSVPGDLSIVGFDDTSLAEMVTPRLTTVRLPATAAGAAAVDLMLDALRGQDLSDRPPVELLAKLIVRSSTGGVSRAS